MVDTPRTDGAGFGRWPKLRSRAWKLGKQAEMKIGRGAKSAKRMRFSGWEVR